MEYQKLYRLISKPWLTTEDIKKICNCSTSGALVIRQEIEEKVLDLQEKKKELSEKLIDAESLDQNLIGEPTEKDIKELLAYENK